jgi:hypothetical protein
MNDAPTSAHPFHQQDEVHIIQKSTEGFPSYRKKTFVGVIDTIIDFGCKEEFARVTVDVCIEGAACRFPVQVSTSSRDHDDYPISKDLAEEQSLSPMALLGNVSQCLNHLAANFTARTS